MFFFSYFNNRKIVGGFVAILIGLILLIFQIPILNNIFENLDNYEKTFGEIVSSHIEDLITYGSKYYNVKIQYRYKVENKPYLSNMISLNNAYGKLFNDEHDAIEFQNNFKLYSSVDVYYNPDEPIKSVLILENFKHNFFTTIKIPILLVLLGASVLLSIKFKLFNYIQIFILMMMLYLAFT